MSVVERFLDYVSYETTSNELSETCPSTSGQLVLGAHLVEELKKIGIANAYQDKDGYVYGYLEGDPNYKTIGLVAHMDTSDQVSGKNIKTRIIENYDGKDIELSNGIYTEVNRFACLKKYIGKTLVVTDGTTLLGADDKAGVAEIMEILDTLIKHPEYKHGLIRVCFTPDEEIGRGVDKFNYDEFKVDFAYTLDGGDPNVINYECFNAFEAKVLINGISVHPGSAKNMMINALNVAHEFHSYLPVEDRPEHTEGYEGFNALMDMSGSVEKAELNYIIRNHDVALIQKQIDLFRKAEKELNEKYGSNTVVANIRKQYQNMKECFNGHFEAIDLVKEAMKNLNMNYREEAIRGGTDGATLSYNGILCPNLGTGGENYHGVNEFACVESMEEVIKLVLEILRLAR